MSLQRASSSCVILLVDFCPLLVVLFIFPKKFKNISSSVEKKTFMLKIWIFQYQLLSLVREIKSVRNQIFQQTKKFKPCEISNWRENDWCWNKLTLHKTHCSFDFSSHHLLRPPIFKLIINACTESKIPLHVGILLEPFMFT